MEKHKKQAIILVATCVMLFSGAWMRVQAKLHSLDENGGTNSTDGAYTDKAWTEGSLPSETEPAVYTQATALKGMTAEEVIEAVAPLFTADMQESGVLASVSLAQFILESGYGKSELSQNANNGFGMKENLSGNTWAGSTWEEGSVYEKKTQEFVNGEYITIVSAFRKYDCLEDSIADHSAYLVGAKRGSGMRYEGIVGETDYREAITIIKNGGYATSPTYITRICELIEQYDLTRYDIWETEP